MLPPLLYHCSPQKQGGKWDTVRPCGSGGLKMVLTLLTETIVVYVWVPVVEVGKTSFEGLSLRLCLYRSESFGLQVGHHKLFKQFIGNSRSGNRSIWRSHTTCYGSPFRVYRLIWLAGADCAWWNVFSRAQASCHLCGIESNWASPNGLADPLGLEQLEL